MLPEISEYLASLDRQRAKILETLATAPADAWNWAPTGDETNSLYVLAKHCIGSEHGWIFEILGRGEKTRQRETEFLARAESLDDLRAEFQRVANESHEILNGLTNDDLATTRYRESHGEVTVRWIILHVIEHFSEHLGQMYLTKQLWEQNKTRD